MVVGKDFLANKETFSETLTARAASENKGVLHPDTAGLWMRNIMIELWSGFGRTRS